MKKILIISYIFPPTPGIGGRRWAKFAKYLHRKGYDVKVITAKIPYNNKSNWYTDVKELTEENRILYIKSGRLKYMSSPKTFFDKIMYRVSLFYLKLRLDGQYYDSSILWEKYLIPVVDEHIKNGYKTIVATGAPFRYLTFLEKLKDKYDNIKLIADIRDPWMNNKVSYNYATLSEKRYVFEKKAEKSIVKFFDIIITVSNIETEYFSHLDEKTQSKFITIPNGFDSDDMKLPDEYEKKQADKLVFVYTGTFYQKAMPNLNELIKVLDKIKKRKKYIYEKLQFDFYGSVPQDFYKVIENHGIIKFHGQIALNEVVLKIYNSSATMIFLPPDAKHYFVTKFYEYISILP